MVMDHWFYSSSCSLENKTKVEKSTFISTFPSGINGSTVLLVGINIGRHVGRLKDDSNGNRLHEISKCPFGSLTFVTKG